MFQITNKATVYMDITEWLIQKSDRLNNQKQKMEELYPLLKQEQVLIVVHTMNC